MPAWSGLSWCVGSGIGSRITSTGARRTVPAPEPPDERHEHQNRRDGEEAGGDRLLDEDSQVAGRHLHRLYEGPLEDAPEDHGQEEGRGGVAALAQEVAEDAEGHHDADVEDGI